LNFAEKDRLNKIKQQRKEIKAHITKKEISILEMKSYIKDKNKLHDNLIKQENELSTTKTFSSSPIEKTEEELKEEIANKIVRDRFLQYQDRVNYSKIEKNIFLQNEKSKEFQQIQNARTSYYDVPTLVYSVLNIFLIEDEKRS
jgi:hypothetical protein